jgi:hypothetical protein
MAEIGAEGTQTITVENGATNAPAVAGLEKNGGVISSEGAKVNSGIIARLRSLFSRTPRNEGPIPDVTPASSREINPPSGPQVQHPEEAKDLAAKTLQSVPAEVKGKAA